MSPMFNNLKVVSIEEVLDTNPDTYIKRAEYQLLQGNVGAAMRECDQAIEFSTEKSYPMLEKARITYSCGKYDECMSIIEDNLALFSKEFDFNKMAKALIYLYMASFNIDSNSALRKAKFISLDNGRAYPNGRRYDYYVGQWDGQYANGLGVYFYGGGDTYVGQWKDTYKDGKGIYFYSHGDKYIGGFKNDEVIGQGVYFTSEGDKYFGNFRDSQLNGYGFQFTGDRTICYEGNFINSQWNGRGILYGYMTDGSKRLIRGNFDCSKGLDINGYGVIIDISQDGLIEKYEGDLKQCQKNGHGTVYYSEGKKCTGDWVNGELKTSGNSINMTSREIDIIKKNSILDESQLFDKVREDYDYRFGRLVSFDNKRLKHT